MSRSTRAQILSQRVAAMHARAQEKREERMLHAEGVIQRYLDACRVARSRGLLFVTPTVTFNPDTGYYCVTTQGRVQKIREKVLTEAADYYYARDHEAELNAPED